MLNFMTEPTDFSSLPWITLVTLACGYIGYFIANVGSRDHHKQIDVAFSSLVFGLLAASVYHVAMGWKQNEIIATSCAVAVSVLGGAVWSIWGIGLLRYLLRVSGVSFADDTPRAWTDLFTVKNNSATALYVETKNGTVYLSEGLHRFIDLPNGPCVLGSSGDILMYATDTLLPNGSRVSQDDLEIDGWGTAITYIPASEVVRVRLRRQ